MINKNKIIVTGASGKPGHYLVKHLREHYISFEGWSKDGKEPEYRCK